MNQWLVPCLFPVQMLVLSSYPDVQRHLYPFHLSPYWAGALWSSLMTCQTGTEADSTWEFWALSLVVVEREGDPSWMCDWTWD